MAAICTEPNYYVDLHEVSLAGEFFFFGTTI